LGIGFPWTFVSKNWLSIFCTYNLRVNTTEHCL